MATPLTKKEREFFIDQGYKFWFEKMSVDLLTRFWQCSNRFSDDCPVRIHTEYIPGSKTHA